VTLLFRNGANLPATIVAAVRTHEVWGLELLALRAGPERHRLQRVVGPALGGAGLGMTSFRVWHDQSFRPSRSRRLLRRGSAQRASHAQS
jgi:hypothetical protein